MLNALLFIGFMVATHPAAPITNQAMAQLSMTCNKSGEQISDAGKVCSYDCAGTPDAVTIGADAQCAASVQH